MGRILALTGGVGGAKLALGLSQILAPDELLFAVNTGDDFEHLGLHISPDLDSLTYALSQQNNTETGWGRAGESWNFIETLGALGGEAWFRLGDKDLALHTARTQMLKSGATLSQATAAIQRKCRAALAGLLGRFSRACTRAPRCARACPFSPIRRVIP